MNNLSIDAQEFLKFIERRNTQLENAPFVNSAYSNPEEWGTELQKLYIRKLDIVDYDGRDSSYQYYLIKDENFPKKVEEYTQVIKNMNDDDLSKYMDWEKGHENFNHSSIQENLMGMKEPYRLARRIAALEYRALIEAIRINGRSKELESDALSYCHRNLASSFNQNYHEI
ncbi:TPA: hypothetical protein PPD39_003727 [Acinetobacter baumannii]|nr:MULTISPECIES: hypothetical protein [Acinetobacter]KQE43694.1 hypothetical protein APD45_07605 [Acinetobacter baumannii]MCA4386458.1 hypothetical protein [Acinetobacter baumannii]MCQ1078352.1 hypothetical protein [Acinetobacter baumannii]MCQ1078366.1 hypothetical protein [Acinetobacter baumannii]MCU4314500.1 hypothetical protein [Acinetobacter bereziniae]